MKYLYKIYTKQEITANSVRDFFAVEKFEIAKETIKQIVLKTAMNGRKTLLKEKHSKDIHRTEREAYEAVKTSHQKWVKYYEHSLSVYRKEIEEIDSILAK